MKMTRAEYILLVEKVAAGSASDAELALYNASFEAFQQNEESWEQLGLNPVALERESLENLQATIEALEAKPIKLWPKIRTAVGIAAAVAVIVFGVWFLNTEREIGKQVQDAVVVNDIAPGKNGATITLANGKVIQLSDAKSGVVINDGLLTYNDQTAVFPGEAGNESYPAIADSGAQELTASTSRGQTYEFTLPDGSKVWLNADSKISFPSQFSGRQRKILLSGEAYFEVAKNKSKPFIVETAAENGMPGQKVTVLGTHFNINSYADEGETKTTLLEGSVDVNKVVLKPNQQAALNANNKITVKEVDPSQAMAWKNGDFSFVDQPIALVMKAIARWYDVQVVYEGPAPEIDVNASISRNRNISQVLKMMEKTKEVKFRIEGKSVFVSK